MFAQFSRFLGRLISRRVSHSPLVIHPAKDTHQLVTPKLNRPKTTLARSESLWQHPSSLRSERNPSPRSAPPSAESTHARTMQRCKLRPCPGQKCLLARFAVSQSEGERKRKRERERESWIPEAADFNYESSVG